jgi:hypothetical protein
MRPANEQNGFLRAAGAHNRHSRFGLVHILIIPEPGVIVL